MTNKSDHIGALAAALAKAQGDIKSAVKDATNPFFKSSYADLPAVVKACKAALSENGIAYIQTTDFLEQDLWLETILTHASGEWISGRYPVRPVKNDPQGMGSAMTYARRYSLAAMVGVVAENEDDDAEAAHGRNPQAAAIHNSPTMPKTAPASGTMSPQAWAQTACDRITTFNSTEEISAFVEKYQEKIDRLEESLPDMHHKLIGEIEDRRFVLSK